eukprot:TCONS_00045005-protein
MLLSRTSNVIYKPSYYCLLSNKFSAGFAPTTWHSSSANSLVSQFDNEFKKTKEASYITSLLPNELRKHKTVTVVSSSNKNKNCDCDDNNIRTTAVSMSELRSSSIFKKINPLEDVY